ncbi:MAG: NAD-dependent epimerase/dehydratase family protein, partial [Nitrososphaeraceae archaeon]
MKAKEVKGKDKLLLPALQQNSNAKVDQQRDVVVVTGGSGYIGSAVVKKLAGQFRVVAFDRETSPHPAVVAECVCID